MLAEAVGKRLKNALLQVNMKAQDDGTLYGAVNASVVVDVIEKAKGFRVDSFVFRTLAGGIFCALFCLRGFAVAVYTHAIYDVYVLVFTR